MSSCPCVSEALVHETGRVTPPPMRHAGLAAGRLPQLRRPSLQRGCTAVVLPSGHSIPARGQSAVIILGRGLHHEFRLPRAAGGAHDFRAVICSTWNLRHPGGRGYFRHGSPSRGVPRGTCGRIAGAPGAYPRLPNLRLPPCPCHRAWNVRWPAVRGHEIPAGLGDRPRAYRSGMHRPGHGGGPRAARARVRNCGESVPRGTFDHLPGEQTTAPAGGGKPAPVVWNAQSATRHAVPRGTFTHPTAARVGPPGCLAMKRLAPPPSARGYAASLLGSLLASGVAAARAGGLTTVDAERRSPGGRASTRAWNIGRTGAHVGAGAITQGRTCGVGVRRPADGADVPRGTPSAPDSPSCGGWGRVGGIPTAPDAVTRRSPGRPERCPPEHAPCLRSDAGMFHVEPAGHRAGRPQTGMADTQRALRAVVHPHRMQCPARGLRSGEGPGGPDPCIKSCTAGRPWNLVNVVRRRIRIRRRDSKRPPGRRRIGADIGERERMSRSRIWQPDSSDGQRPRGLVLGPDASSSPLPTRPKVVSPSGDFR